MTYIKVQLKTNTKREQSVLKKIKNRNKTERCTYQQKRIKSFDEN